MKIISINMNDFGGSKRHLKDDDYQRKYYYNGKLKSASKWEVWIRDIKPAIMSGFFAYIEKEKPDILVLQEFLSANGFSIDNTMNNRGYVKLGNIPNNNASITVIFVKKDICKPLGEKIHDRNARAFAVEMNNGVIIYGTHVPCDDENYWNELVNFYKNHRNDRIMLVGDFNLNLGKKGTIPTQYNTLIMNGAIDLWTDLGKPANTATFVNGNRIDYAFVSPSMRKQVVSMQIDEKNTINTGLTDHAALIVEISDNETSGK